LKQQTQEKAKAAQHTKEREVGSKKKKNPDRTPTFDWVGKETLRYFVSFAQANHKHRSLPDRSSFGIVWNEAKYFKEKHC